MSSYSFFAKYYDELTQNVEYSRRADYFSALLLSCGFESGTVLDLACGTGSLTVELAKHGYDMIGVDASGDMLCRAQNKAFESGVSPMFLCQRMQELDLYGTVDAAVCSLDSINHLTDEEDVRRTFERLRLFVAPGGVFIFDVNTVYKHKNVLGDNAFVYEYPDVFCVWQNSFNGQDNTVDIELDFFEKSGETYKRRSENFSDRAYEIDFLKSLLDKTGFDTEFVFDDMSREPLKEDSQRAVIAARRR